MLAIEDALKWAEVASCWRFCNALFVDVLIAVARSPLVHMFSMVVNVGCLLVLEMDTYAWAYSKSAAVVTAELSGHQQCSLTAERYETEVERNMHVGCEKQTIERVESFRVRANAPRLYVRRLEQPFFTTATDRTPVAPNTTQLLSKCPLAKARVQKLLSFRFGNPL